MRTLLAAATFVVIVLAGCASTRQSRVNTALLDAGMPPPMASCMAEPIGAQLSVSQLRSLQQVAKLARTSAETMTLKQVLDLLQRDLDPETVGVVTRAGLGCLMRG